LLKLPFPKDFLTLNVHKGTRLVVEVVGTKQTSQHEHVHARKELQMDCHDFNLGFMTKAKAWKDAG
jgi:hypothetical protein